MSAVVQLMAIDRIVQGVPEITLDANLFGTAFVTVLVIMDPIGNIPIFLSLTRGQSAAQRHRSALLASTVAGAVILAFALGGQQVLRSEEHTSELQSLMRISYAVFCLTTTTIKSL